MCLHYIFSSSLAHLSINLLKLNVYCCGHINRQQQRVNVTYDQRS